MSVAEKIYSELVELRTQTFYTYFGFMKLNSLRLSFLELKQEVLLYGWYENDIMLDSIKEQFKNDRTVLENQLKKNDGRVKKTKKELGGELRAFFTMCDDFSNVIAAASSVELERKLAQSINDGIVNVKVITSRLRQDMEEMEVLMEANIVEYKKHKDQATYKMNLRGLIKNEASLTVRIHENLSVIQRLFDNVYLQAKESYSGE